jgi:hypothetical protein
MGRDAGRAVTVAVLLGLAGCSGGGGTTSPTTAVLAATHAPNPIRATACPPASCGPLLGELEAAASLNVRETAGVGVMVETVALTFRMADGRVRQGEMDAAAVARAAGSSRVAAGGSLTIPVAMHFTPGTGVLPGVLTVAANFTDERGNRVGTTADAAVN